MPFPIFMWMSMILAHPGVLLRKTAQIPQVKLRPAKRQFFIIKAAGCMVGCVYPMHDIRIAEAGMRRWCRVWPKQNAAKKTVKSVK
ncbi:MAG: hypothetical protein ACO1PN_09210 [Betaproteobacteria bacterium]